MFLLDTMVLSELAKRAPDRSVSAWFAPIPTAVLHVSVISLGEIAAGVLRQRTVDPLFADRLDRWASTIRDAYEARTLPITTAIALRWGELYGRLKRRDADIFIAATALEHDLTVVTRNTRHFQPIGVKLFNPYEAA